ncbi:BolA family protein [Celerinatantimonas yamalensis]|uniref:BolA/IbaG family iron-sulfur metabolism protein n=1 Tax=Celerinatantimonas yamalensis TaxID=559956 RepID=A0ABW9G9H5_9GAMM
MSVEDQINERLHQQFAPSYLQVENESHRHHVPAGSESHFKVVIVSEQFIAQKLLARHRQVNESLAELLAGPIHALAIHTYTASEWQARQSAPESPNCRGSD